MSLAHQTEEVPSASDDVAGQRRTANGSIIAAAFQMVLMLGAGLATGSLGLVSAGVESTGDVVAAVVTFFAVRLRPAPPAPRGPPPPPRAPPSRDPFGARGGDDPRRRRAVRHHRGDRPPLRRRVA